MSGEMHAVVPDLKEKRPSTKDLPLAIITEKEKAVAKQSGASAFDRLIEVNLELTKSVDRLVKTSYVTQAMQFALFLLLIYMLNMAPHK